ncbi:hypothetical protein APR04_005781 [Promicromonospora umidemergens]|uniref:Uncharacterized protein n=1 Tax=Promicromonospora umidemergens TaxID=629679 RepID=A0ABP8WN26_9MICO|nr:hypothetical protein [Promicromonospora umidemergens]MCP2286841.1 hypothetical protein [Promicromonospora umidemergens]
MTQRTEDLAAARRLLLALSEGLSKAGQLLFTAGLADEGRTVSRMVTDLAAMRRSIRTAHNAAIAAERGTTATEDNR